MSALTAQEMKIMRLFVMQVIVGTAIGATQYSAHKQTNTLINLTPSRHRHYQLLLAAHKRCFLEENKLSFSLCFLLTIISAEKFIVSPASLPSQELLKKHS